MNSALVVRDEHGHVSVITLNRPAQRNALSYESWTQLAAALDDAVGAGARAIVITGAGQFFSAGGDLKTGPAHGTGPLAPAGRVEHAQRVLEQLKSLPVPIIAAVEGAAVGLGWSLALSCDLVVAADNAFFSAPFVARAVVPDGGIAWRLTQQLGRQRAARLLMQEARLTASDAERLGLVTDVVDPGTALQQALRIANELCDAEPGALEMTKRLINSAEAAQLAAFHPLELAIAAVAQQRSAAADERAGFG
jgi:enoyl-CoA hydratase/carnithine racemase